MVPREVGSCRVRARRMPVRRLVGLRPLPAGVLQGDAGAEGTSGSSRGWRLRPSLDVPLISHRVELTATNFRISLGLGGHSYWLHALIENTRFSIRAWVLFLTSMVLFPILVILSCLCLVFFLFSVVHARCVPYKGVGACA